MTTTVAQRLADHREYYRSYGIAGGLRIRQFGDILELPVLGGHDVSREHGSYLCRIVGGAMRDALGDDLVEVTLDSHLRGWGGLDGPSYRLTPRGAGWCISCPASVIAWLCEHAGLLLSEAE